MLASISSFFENYLSQDGDDSPEDKAHALQLATAALLVEMCLTDKNIDERETDKLLSILKDRYGLQDEELDTLMALAHEEARDATSLYQFTSLLNEHYQYPDKVLLIQHLWEVAYADENLDRYEEQLIRRVADLLYVSHGDFIRSKLQVEGKL